MQYHNRERVDDSTQDGHGRVERLLTGSLKGIRKERALERQHARPTVLRQRKSMQTTSKQPLLVLPRCRERAEDDVIVAMETEFNAEKCGATRESII